MLDQIGPHESKQLRTLLSKKGLWKSPVEVVTCSPAAAAHRPLSEEVSDSVTVGAVVTQTLATRLEDGGVGVGQVDGSQLPPGPRVKLSARGIDINEMALRFVSNS